MKMQRTLTASLALLIISASGLAAAGPEKKEKRNKDVLRGPKVTQTTPAQQNRPSDSMTNRPAQPDRPNKADPKGKDRASHPITFRDYQLAIRQLSSKRATKALNITDDQQAKIRTISQEHRQAMQAFLEKHKEKIAAMRQRIKQSKTNQQKNQSAIEPANKRDSQQDNQASQAREKLRNFIDSAPANKEALAKLRKVLTPDQLDAIKSHIKLTRAKQANRPDQPQRSRGKKGAQNERSNTTQTDRPNTQRRKMNRDRITNTAPKGAKRDKEPKGNRPASKDD